MPTADWGLYEQGLTTGTEVSSTYEGRHITATAAELNHGNILGVVTKGYPVIFGINAATAHGVGVAFNTEVAGTDLIAVDTEGIWNLTVTATDDAAGAGGVVRAGDPLYINTATAIISKIRNLVTQIPFGYALGGIAQDLSLVIAVKVHWDPRQPQDEFGIFLDGHESDVADNLMSINLTDQTTITSGYQRTLALAHTSTGVKTGTATIDVLAIEMFVSAACPAVQGMEEYMEITGNPVIGRLTALECYHTNRGTGVASDYMVMLGRNSNAVLTGPGNDAFIYFREHSTVQQESSVLMLQGNNAAEYLIAFGSNPDTGLNLLETDNTGDNWTHRVRCNTTVGVRYIKLSDA